MYWSRMRHSDGASSNAGNSPFRFNYGVSDRSPPFTSTRLTSRPHRQVFPMPPSPPQAAARPGDRPYDDPAVISAIRDFVAANGRLTFAGVAAILGACDQVVA